MLVFDMQSIKRACVVIALVDLELQYVQHFIPLIFRHVLYVLHIHFHETCHQVSLPLVLNIQLLYFIYR